MANLSQIKRNKMLEFLNIIKEKHKDDDQALKAIYEIENEITSKKYGLVWEEHEENVDKQMKTHIPVFTEVKNKEVVGDKISPNFNFLLEGDNLHSLKLLEKTHKGKIDVIYIDPPYNTGNKDFIYDDNFVEKEDGYRHSKWLSFMEKRLILAKELLNNKGVIFISIDNNEHSQLKLLCDEVFGKENFIATIPRLTSPQRFSQEKNINISNDFVLVYSKTEFLNLSKIIIENKSKKILKKDSIGLYYEGDTKALIAPISQGYSKNCDYDIEFNGKIYKPINTKGVRNRWFWTKERMQKAIDLGIIRETKSSIRMQIYQDKAYDVRTNTMIDKEPGVRFTTLDLLDNSYSNPNGITDFSKIEIESDFNNPKPVALIKTLVKLHYSNSLTVLDFFAGSGTTAQAVIQLNKEDAGNRKYIICTNNENNICEDVTYQRLINIQNELPHNFKYYKTDFIPKTEESDDVVLSDEFLNHIKEMVQLEQGIDIDNKKYHLILTDEEADQMEKEWGNHKECKALYISKNVLLTTKQNSLFSSIDINTIPDYYFESELREVGEIW